MSQPFFVAEQFTGTPGKYVKLDDTIRGFKMIMNGELDHYPESAFLMKGTIEEVIEQMTIASNQPIEEGDSHA